MRKYVATLTFLTTAPPAAADPAPVSEIVLSHLQAALPEAVILTGRQDYVNQQGLFRDLVVMQDEMSATVEFLRIGPAPAGTGIFMQGVEMRRGSELLLDIDTLTIIAPGKAVAATSDTSGPICKDLAPAAFMLVENGVVTMNDTRLELETLALIARPVPTENAPCAIEVGFEARDNVLHGVEGKTLARISYYDGQLAMMPDGTGGRLDADLQGASTRSEEGGLVPIPDRDFSGPWPTAMGELEDLFGPAVSMKMWTTLSETLPGLVSAWK